MQYVLVAASAQASMALMRMTVFLPVGTPWTGLMPTLMSMHMCSTFNALQDRCKNAAKH